MADSRQDLINKIDSQRSTIQVHVDKYEKFKANGDYTSSATKTIANSQALIQEFLLKDKSIDSSWEDTWSPS